MKTYAARQPARDPSRRKRLEANSAPSPQLRSLPTSSTDYTVLQRQPVCVCDGGCPRCVPVQAELKVGQPEDAYEQEADRIADAVMRMPEPDTQRQAGPEEEEEPLQAKPLAVQITPLVQSQVAPEEEEEEEPLQAKLAHGDMVRRQEEDLEEEEQKEAVQTKRGPGQAPRVSAKVAAQIRPLKGGGQPLPLTIRNFFEPRFGADFSHVRVHTDARAAASARSVNAIALTVGRDVVFGVGQYAPDTETGRRLLAHELTHVVQQREGQISKQKTNRQSPRLGKPEMNSGGVPVLCIAVQRRTKTAASRAATRYIRLIDVRFTSTKDIPSLLWSIIGKGMRASFPGLSKRTDFTFDYGEAKAKYSDKSVETFDVSGGAIKKRRFKTHRTGRRKFASVFRMGGPNYVSSKGDPMPHASFFYRGQAFHGCGARTYLASLFAPLICLSIPSHGCIHVNNKQMAKIYPFIKVKRTKVRIV